MKITSFGLSVPAATIGTVTSSLGVRDVAMASNTIPAAGYTIVATSSNTMEWQDARAFGSNTADVSSVGTMGASASNTRADHVHRGVHLVSAAGSNSLYGDVNLAAGSGIALAVSGQSATISGLGATADHSHSQLHARSHDHGAAGDGTALAPGTVAISSTGTSALTIGGDSSLYRAAAAILASNSHIRVVPPNATTPKGFTVLVSGEAQNRVTLDISGAGVARLLFGDGVTAPDVIIYRSAVDTLKTDDALVVGRRLNTPTEVVSAVDADQNNFAPAGIADASSLRFTSFTAPRTLTGLIAGAAGDHFMLVNNTGQNLVLAHESGSSSSTNRFRCPGAASVTVRAGGSVHLFYANTRWSVVAI